MKLSVLMITYNHEKFIAQALDSVLMQKTNFNYEIVIGDDCSTDGTRGVLLEFQVRYPNRIRLLLWEKNQGITRNFIRTANTCQGEYIAICEGDDYWTDPRKLQKQVDFLDGNPEFAMCTNDVIVKYEDQSRIDTNFKQLIRDVFYIEDVIESILFATNSLLFRRAHIKELPEWFEKIISGDRALLILVAAKGKIKYLNEVMGVYRKHDGGFSMHRDLEKIFPNDMFLFERINVHFNFRYKKHIQDAILAGHRHMLNHYIATNNKYRSYQFLLKCLCCSIRSKKFYPTFFIYSFYNICVPERVKFLYRQIKKNMGT